MQYAGIADTTCLVTGAGQGIGAAIAVRLARCGARVAVLDLRPERARDVAAGIQRAGGAAVAIAADVSSTEEIERAVASVERDLGHIQTLINAAGVLAMGAAVSFEDEAWERLFTTNTRGVFVVARAVAARMVPRRSGSIVTVGSNAAGVPRMRMAAYCASKAAAGVFTKCLGLELAEYGIRCNVVCPGSTDTPMQRSMWTSPADAEQVVTGSLSSFRVGIPLRKIATPEDVANAVLFLASSQASHITMQDLYVDGGAALGI